MSVICFNFRTDRCREITQVLTQTDFPEFGMKKLSLHYTTMTEYDQTFKNVHIIFENDNLNNTLGEVIAEKWIKTNPHCGNRKISACHFLFQRRQRSSF